jgi:hypothetical protein
MATLAGMYNRIMERGFDPAKTAPAPKMDTSVRVRAFPNEDVYFFVKKIDNSGLRREADPLAGGTCWKLIGAVVAAVVLLVCVLLPSAYSLLAGYQVQALRQEGQRLATEQASLELEEAQLVSPARMEQLAREQQFVDPPSQKVVYLENGRNGSLAMNQK